MADLQLSRAEWRAVSAAFIDASRYGCGDLEEPSRARRLLRRLFTALTGLEPARPLANPHLETLRRFVCAARRRGEPPEELAEKLIADGFNPSQVRALAMLSMH